MPARKRHSRISSLRSGLRRAEGFTLIELLIAMTLMVVVVGATLTALEVMMRTQNRDQAYAAEVTATQTTFARLVHDLRQVTMFRSVTPNSISFQMVESGRTYNVAYSCTASDTLGGAYTRCAETQAVSPALPSVPTSKPGSLDIQHITNGQTDTFCTSDGSAQSGSVFFPENPSIANTDGSTLPCDEAHELEIAGLTGGPTYMQVRVVVPASGDLARGGLTHSTVLSSGVFLPNLDAGS